MRAAVPAYMGSQFDGANPGARFGLYFRGWKDDEWKLEDNKLQALQGAERLTEADKEVLRSIRDRQKAQFEASPANGERLKLAAVSTSPFMTGLGNEHPTENGFSFLNPYGLPYLPGSAVKGVVRRAAAELAEGDEDKSRIVKTLFGNESQAGAVHFWDAIPKLSAGKLAIEVMTPHFSEYYQGKEVPHDSGSPNPILFLAVPPGSEFNFYVICKQSRLGTEVPEWRDIVREAMFYAFDWLGFGAKTSVGYGAMKRSENEVKKERAREEEERLRKQQVEEERQSAEAARLKEEEEKQREAERARMPESERLLLTATETLEQWLADQGNPTKKQAAETELKRVRESIPRWKDSEDRERAAQLQNSLWENERPRPGMNKKQRDRQAKKRDDILRRIREGK